MPRPISQAEFTDTIPHYVSQAYELTDAIVEKGLNEPGSAIQLSAARAMRLGWLTDHEELQELWPQRVDAKSWRYTFNADIGLDGMRLAVQRRRLECAAWLYTLPIQNMKQALDRKNEPAAEGPAPVNWSHSAERRHPANLHSPVWSFTRWSDKDAPDIIRVGLYEHTDEHSLISFGLREIVDVTADDYRRARHPPLRALDEAYLSQGVHTLHTVNLRNILHVMSMVAS